MLQQVVGCENKMSNIEILKILKIENAPIVLQHLIHYKTFWNVQTIENIGVNYLKSYF